MATAHLEPLSSIIRVGAGGSKHGDVYQWSAMVRHLSPTEVEVCGALVAPSVEQWRAIVEAMRGIGVQRVLMRRIKGGVSRDKWITVK